MLLYYWNEPSWAQSRQSVAFAGSWAGSGLQEWGDHQRKAKTLLDSALYVHPLKEITKNSDENAYRTSPIHSESRNVFEMQEVRDHEITKSDSPQHRVSRELAADS